MIKAYIEEHYYEDNYEDGEVPDSYGINEVEERVFKDLLEAIQWAKNTYGDEHFGEIVGDGVLLLCSAMKKLDTDHFRSCDPTEKDIEAWKRGDINLWSDEYVVHFEKTEDVTSDEIEATLTKYCK